MDEHQRIESLLAAAQSATTTWDLAELLQRFGAIIAQATQTGDCWFYLFREDKTPLIVADNIFAYGYKSLPPTVRPLDLIHLLERTQKLESCSDLEANKSPDYEWARQMGFKSILTVPLIVNRQFFGIICAVNRNSICQFTEKQMELVSGIANVIAPAIQNAILFQRVKQITILEERTRLAREMHDDLAQLLGLLNFKMRAVSDLLSDGEVANAETTIQEVRTVGEKAYLIAREAIFNLSAMPRPRINFWDWLNEYLAKYKFHFDVDISLEIDDVSSLSFSPEVETQVSWLIQEALSNVRKHANATNVFLRITRRMEMTEISIEDNGQGFDILEVMKDGKLQFGLQIMRERAESIGGSLQVDPQLGKGTRVTILAPMVKMKND